MNNENWQWWQYFLVIAKQGSLSKAAEFLGLSQPTLSRQLQAMEKKYGQVLFDRSTQGLSLTEFGRKLLDECEEMQTSADRLQRLAAGHTQSLSGRVRLSVNEIIALYNLPTIIPSFMEKYPDVSVEIEVSNLVTNIDKRDADVAIRMFRPTQMDLICRHLFDLPLGFYASKKYIEDNGTPKNTNDFLKHKIIGYDRSLLIEEGSKNLGLNVKNEHFNLRTDFAPLHIELAINDGGIIVMNKDVSEAAGLVEIDLGIAIPPQPVYLVCHRDVQHNKRIRALMDHLAENLAMACV